jgi:radical SAM protein with 4Fe4S-binding SPASM domain
MTRKKSFYRLIKLLLSINSNSDIEIIFRKAVNLLLKDKIYLYRYTKIPPIIQIEPTNYCNLNCIICPVSQSSRKRGYIDINLFKKIIDDASQVGVKQVYFFLHGEPLLHPQFFEMVHYIKNKNLSVIITNNGTLFDKGKIDDLFRSGVNSNDLIMFSILGYSKEIHEMVQLGVIHEHVLNNVLNMVELRKKLNLKGPKIELIFYITPENEHEKNQYEEYWCEIVDKVNIYHYSKSFSKSTKPDLNIPPRNKTCWHLWKRIVVCWNGDVVLCSADVNGEYILGNLEKQSIREIWNSEKMLSIKKLHKNRKIQEIPFCSRCDY